MRTRAYIIRYAFWGYLLVGVYIDVVELAEGVVCDLFDRVRAEIIYGVKCVTFLSQTPPRDNLYIVGGFTTGGTNGGGRLIAT